MSSDGTPDNVVLLTSPKEGKSPKKKEKETDIKCFLDIIKTIQTQYTNSKVELTNVLNNYRKSQEELAQIKENMATLQCQFENSQKELDITKTELNLTRSKLNNSQKNVDSVQELMRSSDQLKNDDTVQEEPLQQDQYENTHTNRQYTQSSNVSQLPTVSWPENYVQPSWSVGHGYGQPQPQSQPQPQPQPQPVPQMQYRQSHPPSHVHHQHMQYQPPPPSSQYQFGYHEALSQQKQISRSIVPTQEKSWILADSWLLTNEHRLAKVICKRCGNDSPTKTLVCNSCIHTSGRCVSNGCTNTSNPGFALCVQCADTTEHCCQKCKKGFVPFQINYSTGNQQVCGPCDKGSEGDHPLPHKCSSCNYFKCHGMTILCFGCKKQNARY
jgi:hypothetical protein